MSVTRAVQFRVIDSPRKEEEASSLSLLRESDYKVARQPKKAFFIARASIESAIKTGARDATGVSFFVVECVQRTRRGCVPLLRRLYKTRTRTPPIRSRPLGRLGVTGSELCVDLDERGRRSGAARLSVVRDVLTRRYLLDATDDTREQSENFTTHNDDGANVLLSISGSFSKDRPA